MLDVVIISGMKIMGNRNKHLTVSECDTGHYPNSAFDCIPCPIGTYKPSVGSSTCTHCSEGLTTNTTGQTSVDACGRLRQNKISYDKLFSKICLFAYYSLYLFAVIVNTYNFNGSEVDDIMDLYIPGCGKGYYPNDELDSSPCTQCSVGKYKDSVQVNALNAHHIVQPMPKDRHQLMLVVS